MILAKASGIALSTGQAGTAAKLLKPKAAAPQ
jgi:hypothetical protein